MKKMNNHRNFLKKRIQTGLNQNPTPTFSDGVFEAVSNFIDKAIDCNYNNDPICNEKLLNLDEKEKKKEYLLSLFRTIRKKVLAKHNLQQELNIILPLYRDIINRSHQQALNNWSQSI